MLKIHFHFPKCFWDKGCQFILPLAEYKKLIGAPTWFSIVEKPTKNPNEHTLTVCYYGEQALFKNVGDDHHLIADDAEQLLKDIFGDKFIKPDRYHVGHRWDLDPAVLGAWCSLDASITRAETHTLGAPIGHLHFAGDLKGADTVHISMQTAKTAANEIFSAYPLPKFEESALLYIRKKLTEYESGYYDAEVKAEVKKSIKAETLGLFQGMIFDPDDRCALFDLIALYRMVQDREFKFIGAERNQGDKQGETRTYKTLLALLATQIKNFMHSGYATSDITKQAKELLGTQESSPNFFFEPKPSAPLDKAKSTDNDDDDNNNVHRQ